MRIAYLDCFSGISGDMFLGALIDVGVSPKIFEEAVAALNIGAHLKISRVNRTGISGTKVDVIVNGVKDTPKGSRAGMSEPHAHAESRSDANHHEHDHAQQPH